MVAPYRHIADLEELTAGELQECMAFMLESVRLLRQALSPHGFNIGLNLGGAGGAGLKDHLHWHIVPRWEGDTNFMPITAQTKVIPQSLADVWQKLIASH